MDSNLLAGAVDYVLREDLRVHSMTLVRNGYIVLDAYFRPYAAGIPHEVASTTKSFTSTLIGIAIDRELIAGVGEPIFKLLGKEVDAQKAAVRLEDVLTMRSGLTCIWDITAVNTFEFRSSPDWMAFIMKFPAVKPAGEHYCYSNADSHILSAVISKVTGMSAAKYAEKELFGPLGIKNYIWPSDPQGISVGYAELRLEPRDMTKFGLLFLQKGMWDGRRVVSSGWVEAAATAHVKLNTKDDPVGDYGYQWWVGRDFYTTKGRGGQYIGVFPSLNMVGVITASLGPGDDRKIAGLMAKYILAAVKSEKPLPEDKNGEAILASKVAEAAAREFKPSKTRDFKPLGSPAVPTPGLSASGKRFVLERNPLDLAALTVTFFIQGGAVLELDFSGGEKLSLPVGMNGVPADGKGRYGLPAFTAGRWVSPDSLEIELDEAANINRWTIKARFEGRNVYLEMSEPTLGRVMIKPPFPDKDA